jgi:hypothetical protein
MRFANQLQRHLYYRSQIDSCYFTIQELKDSNLLQEEIESAKKLKRTLIRCKRKLGYEPTDEDWNILKQPNHE